MDTQLLKQAPAEPRTAVQPALNPKPQRNLAQEDVEIQVQRLNLHYSEKRALHDISLDIARRRATAFIGPSGCGKSTLLRCFNRMNDLIDDVRVEGHILLNGQDIHDPAVDAALLRRRVGMVFQKPNPFPKTIYENVAC